MPEHHLLKQLEALAQEPSLLLIASFHGHFMSLDLSSFTVVVSVAVSV